MDAAEFVEGLRADRRYRDQIAAVHVIEARDAEHREPLTPLPDSARRVLSSLGVERLYSHQAEAFDAAQSGKDLVVCTGTASGKSLCYNLPVLARVGSDAESRALYLFPAKALAYDQLGGLERAIQAAELTALARPACYDGDTPVHRRAGIRRTANILLSNPDMLHVGILPSHAKWAAFLCRLRFVVLDEIHTYRGIFGSHVAGVIRRLLRICRHYGAAPQFICCSATLGNPRELAERLTGRDVTLIENDGAPRGRKLVVLWNPPWMDRQTRAEDLDAPREYTFREIGAMLAGQSVRPVKPSNPVYELTQRVGFQIARRSSNLEAQHLMQALLEAGAATITFCKARVVAELIYTYITAALRRRRPDLLPRIRPYRGGYLPNERREIERQLFSGELLGVCSTNALELGIDVGTLDAAIIVGFPGTLCSLWQQIGRAGRRQGESLAILVAYDDPVDQYLMRHERFIRERPLERATINPENPHILAAQLGCAAHELPLDEHDCALFGQTALAVAELMTGSRSELLGSAPAVEPAPDRPLHRSGGRYHWARPEFPHVNTSLRTISNATFSIVDQAGGGETVIGEVDSISAPELIYPEAIYLHQGESFIVQGLNWETRTACVKRANVDYYTQPVLADECRLGETRLAGDLAGGRRIFGDVTIRWQTTAFRKFKLFTQELIGQTALDLPAQSIDTVGAWFQPPTEVLQAARRAGHEVHDALSGVRNLLAVALPTLAMSDRYDIGGIVNTSQLGVTTIVMYDRYQGGVGYARRGYEAATELFQMAYAIGAECDCEDGCPGCVGPPNLRVAIHHDPDLGNGYAIPSRRGALFVLREWFQYAT